MTIGQIAEKLNLTFLTRAGGANREVTCGYTGDLLSWVMGRAQADSAWITVMGNINSVAVAVLADVACIILAEGAALDADAREKAEAQEVIVLSGSQSAFELSVGIYGLLYGETENKL